MMSLRWCQTEWLMNRKIRQGSISLNKNFRAIKLVLRNNEFSIRMCICKIMKSLKKRLWEMFISLDSQLCSMLCRTIMLMPRLPPHLPHRLVWAAVTQIWTTEIWPMDLWILLRVNVISKRRLNCSSVFSKTVLTVVKSRKSFERSPTSSWPGTICRCLYARMMITVAKKMKAKMTLQI